MRLTRIFLARRRFDAAFLSLGFALLPLMSIGGKVVFGTFIIGGIYLAAARHRVARAAPRHFSGVLLAYVAWTIGLSVLRGEPLDGNRALSYALVEFGFLFLPLGICLVPRPMDAMVLGARLGVIGICVLAPIQYFAYGERVGLGGNEAIFGFLAASAGIAARLPAAHVPSWLSNGRGIFYLSLLPVLLSQTRAAWSVYALALVFDLFALLKSGAVWKSRALRKADRAKGPAAWLPLAGGAALVAVVLVPLAGLIEQRFDDGMREYRSFEATGTAKGSVDVRIAMWQGAVVLIAKHPLIGVGGISRVDAVAEATPDPARNGAVIRSYRHLHNFALDEALTSGLVGLGLLVGVFVSFLVSVRRWTTSREVRQVALLLPILVASFGSFHGVLLNEWMLIQIFGIMAVILTALNPERIPLARPVTRERHGSA